MFLKSKRYFFTLLYFTLICGLRAKSFTREAGEDLISCPVKYLSLGLQGSREQGAGGERAWVIFAWMAS